MTLFSRIFKNQRALIKQESHTLYVKMLREFCGLTRADANRAVSKAIAACVQEGRAEGTADLPEDLGDRMIAAARMGDQASSRIVNKARREGATDDDIREWWNMPDLSRRMVIWSEDVFRLSVFNHARENDGLSDVEAAARVHKMYPIYGNPDDTSILLGENRPLQHELRGRIDAFRQDHGAEYISSRVSGFSSYNAYIRFAIHSKEI